MELVETLVRRGLVSDAQYALAESQGGDVLASLVRTGVVSHEVALQAMADEVGVGFLDLRTSSVDLSLLDSFPQKIIYREILFPVSRNNGTIVVATSDPLDFYPLDEISAATGLAVEPVLAERSEIAKLIKNHLGVGGETIEGLIEDRKSVV